MANIFVCFSIKEIDNHPGHYALSLEGFWTSPLVIVGDAPSLSQTGYKAYSYSPWAMITLNPSIAF